MTTLLMKRWFWTGIHRSSECVYKCSSSVCLLGFIGKSPGHVFLSFTCCRSRVEEEVFHLPRPIALMGSPPHGGGGGGLRPLLVELSEQVQLLHAFYMSAIGLSDPSPTWANCASESCTDCFILEFSSSILRDFCEELSNPSNITEKLSKREQCARNIV